ncbi:MAG TPA: hypothetical protein VFA48_05970 [Gammaproteobacteria bacterium]|nr:hypothetical protein [Gammaproteobacteria bacterium]
MIFSRFIRNMKGQHWLAFFIDFVIVVVGVFLGIQASNWNQARQNRAAEVVYLRALAKDFDSIGASVQAQIDFETTIAHDINRSLDEIDAPPSKNRTLRLGMLLSQLVARSTLKIESPTFRELQSSGHLGLIRDRALRGSIVEYFFQIRRWESALDRNNEVFVDNGFDVFLRTHGVKLVLWDPEVMHEPSALPSMFATAYLKLMHAQYAGRILAGRNPELDRPPGDPFWDRLRQQLNWRAIIAGRNESIAIHLEKMTGTVKAKTLAYLKGHRS